MALGKPDPRYTHGKKAKSNFRLAVKVAFLCLAALWLVFVLDALFGLKLNRFGLRPGSVPGLIGVVTVPLLHGNLSHIFSNSMSLVVSLTAILYLYPNASARVIPMIWLGSGLLAWLIGRPSLHFRRQWFYLWAAGLCVFQRHIAPRYAFYFRVAAGCFSLWLHDLGGASHSAPYVLGIASFRSAYRCAARLFIPQMGHGAGHPLRLGGG